MDERRRREPTATCIPRPLTSACLRIQGPCGPFAPRSGSLVRPWRRWRFGVWRALRRGARNLLLAALIISSKDHFPRGGLMHRSHGDVDGLVDHLARAIHHHHGAIVQIGHALVVFFSLAQNEYAH